MLKITISILLTRWASCACRRYCLSEASCGVHPYCQHEYNRKELYYLYLEKISKFKEEHAMIQWSKIFNALEIYWTFINYVSFWKIYKSYLKKSDVTMYLENFAIIVVENLIGFLSLEVVLYLKAEILKIKSTNNIFEWE